VIVYFRITDVDMTGFVYF